MHVPVFLCTYMYWSCLAGYLPEAQDSANRKHTCKAAHVDSTSTVPIATQKF